MKFRMIFLDSPSTTPLDPFVLESMLPHLRATGQADRLLGQEERSGKGHAVRQERELVAGLLNCLPNEVVWTSGTTEANKLAILGFAETRERPGRVVSQVPEHSAVLEPSRRLETQGWEVELLPVDEFGRVGTEEFTNTLSKPTDLVLMMWGNNEIGTLQPVAEMAKLCSDRGIALHCDTAQAVGKVPIDLAELPITMLTLSAHKFYGPVGAGALFVRSLAKRNPILPLMYGGGQEHGLRPGTLNVSAIIGLARACDLAKKQIGASRFWRVVGKAAQANRCLGLWSHPKPASSCPFPATSLGRLTTRCFESYCSAASLGPQENRSIVSMTSCYPVQKCGIEPCLQRIRIVEHSNEDNPENRTRIGRDAVACRVGESSGNFDSSRPVWNPRC